MANENEAIADIIAEMRRREKSHYYPKVARNVMHQYANRTEAAWKREREELERYATSKMLDGATIVDNRGNAAAMREALVKCREIALQWQADEADGVAGTTDKPSARSAAEAVMDMEFEINAALSATARNCDVGTAKEQSNRMRKFCAKQKRNGIINCGYCPIRHQYQRDCTLVWAQMPYEAEEGGTK